MAPRVLGRNVKLLVNSSQLLLPIALGEIDEFRATSSTEIVKRRPAGFTLQNATQRYSGYDLQLKIGKTDPMLERWNHLVERGIFEGNTQPELTIIELIKHYDKVLGLPIYENWIYRGVTLFGLEKSYDINEIEQNISGFATHKELGPADITFTNLKWFPGIGFQEVVHREAQSSSISNAIGGVINNVISGIKGIL